VILRLATPQHKSSFHIQWEHTKAPAPRNGQDLAPNMRISRIFEPPTAAKEHPTNLNIRVLFVVWYKGKADL
jgi:hypothetical protein